MIRRANIGSTVPRPGALAASQALDGTTPNPESKGTTMRRASAVLSNGGVPRGVRISTSCSARAHLRIRRHK